MQVASMATCPECEQEVETRLSTCRCEKCVSTGLRVFYFVKHNDSDGAECFGSGHGVKEPAPCK